MPLLSCLNSQSLLSVDFNEDFSAFHGQTMHEQAEYTNEVIKFLLKEYPKIKEVPILAHSMGGIVARLVSIIEQGATIFFSYLLICR